ncbi:hypothetical protein F3V47_22280, partial [Salmonella enterica]|nr:hypothetical protein [Salmonella enterica]
MNISDFEQYEGYWEIIDDNLFDEIFYIDRIEKLEPTEKVMEAIELLSRLFTDDRMEMLEEVRQMN